MFLKCLNEFTLVGGLIPLARLPKSESAFATGYVWLAQTNLTHWGQYTLWQSQWESQGYYFFQQLRPFSSDETLKRLWTRTVSTQCIVFIMKNVTSTIKLFPYSLFICSCASIRDRTRNRAMRNLNVFHSCSLKKAPVHNRKETFKMRKKRQQQDNLLGGFQPLLYFNSNRFPLLCELRHAESCYGYQYWLSLKRVGDVHSSV